MKIKKYFTTNHIIEGLIIAILLSAFIYIEHFELFSGYFLSILNTSSGILGLYLLLRAKTPVWFFSGFFIAIFWLWWISVSFYYYNMPYLIPIVVLIIGLVYGFIFLLLSYISTVVAKKIESKFFAIFWEKSRVIFNALALILIDQIEPFGFNWLKLQLIFTDSVISDNLYAFITVVTILAITIVTKRYYILLALILLIDLNIPKILKPSALRDISLVQTNIDVRDKWKPKNAPLFTNIALKKIDRAILDGKSMVILPESILPYFLNLETPYLEQFLKRSKKITIVIGSLYFKSETNRRNSAFIMKDGSYIVANKVVLVPFGESNPLPSWASKIVNKIFFDGAIEYQADKNYTTIKALNKEFKIAICYEGTASKTYKDKPKFVIVISNNGWFKPSIEPTLQKILLKHYSRAYGTTIYHSVNGSNSYVVLSSKDD